MKSIYIPGVPDVKMRARVARRGTHAHMYDPNADNKEASIQKAQLSGDEHVYQGAIAVSYEFVFPRPKGHYGTGKNAGKLKASSPEFCTCTKDLDNMEKFYADSFNFIHYVDDKQIVQCWGALKRYAKGEEMPHVLMKIFPLEEVDKKSGSSNPPN